VQTVVYEPEQVFVAMNRWRLQLLCHELLQASKKPTFRDALPWLAVFVALLLALLPRTEWKNFLGLEGSVWEAGVVILTITAGVGFLVVVCRALAHISERELSAQDAVQKVLTEMTPKDTKQRGITEHQE